MTQSRNVLSKNTETQNHYISYCACAGPVSKPHSQQYGPNGPQKFDKNTSSTTLMDTDSSFCLGKSKTIANIVINQHVTFRK